MARLNVNMMTRALKRAIHLSIAVPTDHMVVTNRKMPEKNRPYKTFYYLEGALGDDAGPLNYSSMELLAEDYNMVIVCIGGENKWLSDSPLTGDRFIDLVTVDVVNFTRRLFNLSHRREDTYIGGFSMGGHGGFVIGLRHPEIFGRIISLSASLQKMAITTSIDTEDRWDISTATNYKTMFGLQDVGDWVGSDYDYEMLAQRASEQQKDLMPKIFMSCGVGDVLCGPNEAYRDLLRNLGYEVEWLPVNGKHSYYSCNIGLEAAMKWQDNGDNFTQNYPYYGAEADCGVDNFYHWEAFYNIEAGEQNQ